MIEMYERLSSDLGCKRQVAHYRKTDSIKNPFIHIYLFTFIDCVQHTIIIDSLCISGGIITEMNELPWKYRKNFTGYITDMFIQENRIKILTSAVDIRGPIHPH